MNTEQEKMHPYKLLVTFTERPIMTATIFCDHYCHNIDMTTFDMRIGDTIVRIHPSIIFRIAVFETKTNLKIDQMLFKH